MDKTIKISEKTYTSIVKVKNKTGATIKWIVDTAISKMLTKRKVKK